MANEENWETQEAGLWLVSTDEESYRYLRNLREEHSLEDAAKMLQEWVEDGNAPQGLYDSFAAPPRSSLIQDTRAGRRQAVSIQQRTILIDFFHDRLSLLWWDQSRYGEDPRRVSLIEQVSTWKSKLGEDGEDLPRESESEQ